MFIYQPTVPGKVLIPFLFLRSCIYDLVYKYCLSLLLLTEIINPYPESVFRLELLILQELVLIWPLRLLDSFGFSLKK